jgi:hypothetical protein
MLSVVKFIVLSTNCTASKKRERKTEKKRKRNAILFLFTFFTHSRWGFVRKLRHGVLIGGGREWEEC